MQEGNNNAPIFRHCILDIFRKFLLLAFGGVVWTMAVFPYNYFGILFAAIALIKLPLSLWHLHVAMSYRRQQRYWTYLAHEHTQGQTASLATIDDPVMDKVTGTKGIFLGSYFGALLFYDMFAAGHSHSVCIAPARTGKTTCNVMPTLLSEVSCSVYVNDTKEECRDVTAAARKAQGQRIVSIAPFSGEGHDDFNPLYVLSEDVTFNNGHEVHELADIISQCLLSEPQGAGGDHKFFRDGGRRFLVALMLNMAALEAPEDCHLVRLRELVWSSDDNLKIIAKRLKRSDQLNGLLRDYGNQLLNMLDENFTKTFNAFRTEALEGLKIYDPSSPWTEHIKKCDVTFEQFLDGKTTIYNCLPQEKLITHGKHNTLIITLLIEMTARRAGRTRLLMLLDEAGNIPRIPKTTLKSAISLLPSKGLRLYSVWQSFSQIQDLYGEEILSLLMDQASMFQAWSIRDLKQQEEWSKRIGITTVKRSSFNKDAKEMDYPVSQRMEEKEERVLTPTEIALMPDDEQLICISGHPIIKANRVPFWQVEEFRAGAAPNPCEPAGYPAHQPVKYSLRKHAKSA